MNYNNRMMLFISIIVLGLVAMSSRKIPCTGWWFDIHPKLKQECQHNLLFKERRGEDIYEVEDYLISPSIANTGQYRGMQNNECLSWDVTRNLVVAGTCKELGNPSSPYKLTPLPPTTPEWYGTPYPMDEPVPYPPAPTEAPIHPYPTNEPAPYPPVPTEAPVPPYPTNEPVPYPAPSEEPAQPYPPNESAPYPEPGEEPPPLPPYP